MRNSIDLNVVLDRSGSMSVVKQAMEEAMNAYITSQKNSPVECRMTLVQFDDEYKLVHNGVPVHDIGKVTIEPRGSTALLDAIGRLIDDTGARLSGMPEYARPSKVLVVIVTDGQENASRFYSKQQIFDKIRMQRDQYSWEFVFLGADQDSIASATAMGISSGNAFNYSNTRGSVKRMSEALCTATDNYKYASAATKSTFFDGNQDGTDKSVKTMVDSTQKTATVTATP